MSRFPASVGVGPTCDPEMNAGTYATIVHAKTIYPEFRATKPTDEHVFT